MRNYSGLLVLENLFDHVPDSEPDILNLSNSIFTPNVLISENDCNTTLGKYEVVNYGIEGLVELSTGNLFSKARITQILSEGVYEVAIRHTSACISTDGICKKCYSSTYPNNTIPKLLDRVILSPEYKSSTEIIKVTPSITVYPILAIEEEYTKYYVFSEGVLLVENVDYNITDNNLILLITPDADKDIVIRFIKIDRSSYLVWLANTYSGSLLGMKPLPAPPLPIRSLLLTSLLLENRLQLVSDFVKGLTQIPTTYTDYFDLINDPLEKALYLLAVYTIYYNVPN